MNKLDNKSIHIAHVVHSFATGGLENGVVNIINRLPENKYQHSIVCVTSFDAEFVKRIKTNNIKLFELNKPAGRNFGWLVNCWKLLRQLKPDICHTRNLSTIEAQLPAWLAGVNYRIHGEHGWDVNDLGGVNVKYQKLRKFFKPLIHQYIGLSTEACTYLSNKISVKKDRINHICNGVDVDKFSPKAPSVDLPEHFSLENAIVFGTVGRLAEVKNQTFLLDAFLQLWQSPNIDQDSIKLIIVGDGMLMPILKQKVIDAKAQSAVWLTGLRSDIPQLMNSMNVFVLPSLAEGISNTLLEAMASGLPIIATNVGGNVELVCPEHQESHLVTVNNIEQLTNAMKQYVQITQTKNLQLAQNSVHVRNYCVEHYSIASMVEKYHALYQKNNM